MTLNEQLEALYASKWNELCNALRPVVGSEEYKTKPAYPFLIGINRWENKVVDESWYSHADIRVMVFGQETNGWAGRVDDFGTPPSPVFNPDIAMGAVPGIYEDFYASYYGKDGFTYNGNKYGTFFYGLNKLMSLLNQEFPDKEIAYLWNNIVKIGNSKEKGFPGSEIYAIERKRFSVIPEEIALLKPDIIIFLTGTYDDKIRDVFGETTFAPLTPMNEVAKVTLPFTSLAYRTYHPSAHLQKGMMETYYKTIIEDIRTSFPKK